MAGRQWIRSVLLAALAVLPALCVHAARAATVCGVPNAVGASACFIDPKIDPLALCNDGTLPAFWIRPGAGAGAAQWIIWLEGGGQCTDQPSCAARANTPGTQGFLTSIGFSAGTGSGILSPERSENPALYNATVVLVHYCSSDDWSGDGKAVGVFDGDDPTTWNFRGRRIALAAIASLKELGPGLHKPTKILLGGSSAGGLGIMVTANDILPKLPVVEDVRIINDAGFTLGLGQYDVSIPAPYVYPARPNAFDALFTSGMTLWHGSGDAICAAQAKNPLARVDCYDAAFLLQNGLVSLPTFVAESQLDTAQLTDELCPAEYGNCPVPTDPHSTQGRYATAFGASMAKGLTGSGKFATWAVFSPDSYVHTMLINQDTFVAKYPYPGAKLRARDVLDDWLGSGAPPRILDIAHRPGVSGAQP